MPRITSRKVSRLISVLRTYTPEELREMTRDLQAEGYRWEIGELAVKGVPVKVPYLIGVPLKRS